MTMQKNAPAPREHKIVSAFHSVKDADQGLVESYVSVMGNIDHGLDQIQTGAFRKTISERGSKIKVLNQHQTSSIFSTLGKPVDMREVGRDELPEKMRMEYPDATGALWVLTQFNLDTPEGRGAFVRLKSGEIDQWSIGYDPLDTTSINMKLTKTDTGFKKDENGKELRVRVIRTIKLYEYSPVLWGMNEATATVDAKEAPGEEPPQEESEEIEEKDDILALKQVKEESLMQRVRDVSRAFDEQRGEHDNYIVTDVYESYVIVKGFTPEANQEYPFYKVRYMRADSGYVFASSDEWDGGNYVFVTGEKAFDRPTVVVVGAAPEITTIEELLSKAYDIVTVAQSQEEIEESNEDGPSEEIPVHEEPVVIIERLRAKARLLSESVEASIRIGLGGLT